MANFRVYNANLNRFPVVVDLPHSGTKITSSMAQQLLPTAILANTDWFLRELYDFLPKLGFTVLENNLNRYLIDPNRDPKEKLSGTYYHLIYTQNTFGHPLYKWPLSPLEIDSRINQYYKPYHQQLDTLLKNKLAVFGKVLLLDLHSFAEYTHPTTKPTADVVLGNDFNQTASRATLAGFKQLFEAQNYTVEENFPFRGGYITRHYGSQTGVQAIQIELRYNQYIGKRFFDEEVLNDWDPSTFNCTKQRLQKIFETLTIGLNESN